MTQRTFAKSRLAVAICSVGRPDCVRDLIEPLVRQTRQADLIVFAVTRPEDIGFDPSELFPDETEVSVVLSEKGLPRQRNAALDKIGDRADIVVFYDDDFVPTKTSLAGVEAFFDAFADVNGATGDLIADGIHGAGYSHGDAMDLVTAYERDHSEQAPTIIREGLAGLYGCNMVYRLTAVGTERFDETLPLYGWQEDIDFAARIPGRRVKTDAFAGVHRGAKSGRETAGRRLGYSQMANPWYLWRKGTMTRRFALRLMSRNLVANHIKMLRPEPWIDRRARARGNWKALAEIATGRADPRRILDM
ncbi:glycosyltransferase family 2 protein [Jannaschia aquimarina]|uniref:Glycosyl transferase family 2 n=1 Tax=Jannaschia aquimarina TaxID=935700 RepID=A0A0D1EKN3_9RHOB|nr:glycosyltransferase [Jannaschia aquimarina]KIT16300.1 hypothetical protein jaqu_18960 [Jannaschia aquimarina]SNT26620.1 Glycosyltransferase like family 2 [Jannaschia aquimarina]